MKLAQHVSKRNPSQALNIAKRHDNSASCARFSAEGSAFGREGSLFRYYVGPAEKAAGYVVLGAWGYIIGTAFEWARFTMDGSCVETGGTADWED